MCSISRGLLSYYIIILNITLRFLKEAHSIRMVLGLWPVNEEELSQFRTRAGLHALRGHKRDLSVLGSAPMIAQLYNYNYTNFLHHGPPATVDASGMSHARLITRAAAVLQG